LGFTASKNILEGDVGFLNAFTEQKNYDIEKITAGLGDPFAIISPGVGKKLYPSCAATHGFIDGIFSLIDQFDIRAEDVESIDCGIFYLYPNMLIHSSPRTGLEGKFSLEFCLALALKERKVTLDQFTDSKVQDPNITELIKRVKKSVSEEAGGRGTRYPTSIITLRLKNGKTHSYQSEARTGGPMKPLTPDEVSRKFLDCAQLIHSRDKARHILEKMMDFEKLDDVSKLIDLL
jgi:2-methylcitrate dehydratase PrpD